VLFALLEPLVCFTFFVMVVGSNLGSASSNEICKYLYTIFELTYVQYACGFVVSLCLYMYYWSYGIKLVPQILAIIPRNFIVRSTTSYLIRVEALKSFVLYIWWKLTVSLYYCMVVKTGWQTAILFIKLMLPGITASGEFSRVAGSSLLNRCSISLEHCACLH